MRNRAIGGVLFFIGLLIILIPRYILPTCEYHGFKVMACSYTGTAEMFAGFIIVVVSAGIFLSRSNEALRWQALTSLAVGITVLMLPEAIGYCHSSEMPCHYGTVPALRLLGALTVLVSLIGFLLSFRRTNE